MWFLLSIEVIEEVPKSRLLTLEKLDFYTYFLYHLFKAIR